MRKALRKASNLWFSRILRILLRLLRLCVNV